MRFLRFVLTTGFLFACPALPYPGLSGQQTDAPPLAARPAAPIDYSILGQPAVADQVNLTDEQRAAVARILDQRINDLVGAEPADREQIVANSNAELAALLNDEQKQALAASLSDGKLQFNFYRQQWSEVLTWFARQADLSLVMDTEPPGLFTYRDTRQFTPPEAIDLLNSVLLSKGFTLIRRERMLVVVDTSQGVPYDLVQQVPLEKLSDYGRFEIVTTEFPLQGRPIDAVVEAVTPLVGNHGQVVPLPAADKLLVTETTGRLKAINVVVAAVPVPKQQQPEPQPKPPPPVFKTYPAPGLSPDATTEMLRELFPAAKVRFDPAAAVLHCQAPPDVQAGVAASLEQMLDNATGENKPRLQSYAIPPGKLEGLSDRMALAHPDLAIDIDAEKNRLLVVASQQDHDEVAQTLTRLGIAETDPEAAESNRLVLYPVAAESTTIVTSLLENAIPAALVVADGSRIAVRGTAADHAIAEDIIQPFRQPADDGPTLSFYPLPRPLRAEVLELLTQTVPEATIRWLSEEQKLSVLASLHDHRRIAATLAQIKEVGLTAATERVRPHTLDVEVASPSELVEMLRARFPETEMVWNEATRQLHVWADEAELEAFRSAFDTIVAALPPREEIVMVPYTLQHADAAEILTLLTGMRPELTAAVDASANRILVSAPLREQTRVGVLIAQLDVPPSNVAEPQLQTYPLKSIDPPTALAILSPLFPELTLTSDPAQQRLVVNGLVRHQQRFAAALERIDVPQDQSDLRLQSYDLGQVDPTQAYSVLVQLAPGAIISTDARQKRVFVWGDTAEQETVEQAIEQLTQTDPAAARTLKSYLLPVGAGSTAVTYMQPVAPDATLSLDAGAKNLIAYATVEEHERLGKALDGLRRDLSDSSTETTEVYQLKQSTPTTAYTVLSPLVPGATLSVDPATSVLAATATAEQHAKINAVIERLERPSESPRTLQAYPLPKNAAATAVSFMQPVAPDATLSVDAKAENLIAFATAEEHQALADAVRNLRTDLAAGNGKTTEVYRFRNSSPISAYTVLSTLVPEATLAVDATAGVLVATATAEQHATIAGVAAKVEQDPASLRTMKAYPLPKSAAATALSIMQPVASKASLTLDAKYENLIAYATEQEHAAIQAAMEGLRRDLNDAASEDQVVTVYPVPRDLITVSSLLPSLDDSLTDQLDIQLNSETNSLIVRGGAEQHRRFAAALETIIDQLPEPEVKISQVYRFENGDSRAAYRTLAALVPEATFALDDDNSALVATARLKDQLRIKAVVDQLDAVGATAGQTTQIYQLHRASARTAQRAFEQLAPKARIGYDSDSNVVIATASAADHTILAAATAQLDGRTSGGEIRIYPLANVTAEVAQGALQAMVDRQEQPMSIQINELGNSLIVTGDEQQHQQAKNILDQLDRDDRQLQVFPLRVVDPFTVEMAVDDLYRQLPASSAPTLSTDYETNKLFVRGTTSQLEQVRNLLTKLGEPMLDVDRGSGGGATRTVYLQGDPQAAIEQLQSIWPQLRQNRIEIVTPAERGIEPIVPSGEPRPSPAAEPQASPATEPAGNTQSKLLSRASAARLVVFQNTLRAEPPADDPAEPTPSKPQPPGSGQDLPPVVVTAGQDRITITSADSEALDRMEALLRTIAANSYADNSSNFAIFLLRHTGATDMELMLKKVIEDLPYQRGGLSNVVIAADDRLNALIVHGNRQSRELIGQLLEALDSQELRDPLNVYRSEIIPLQHAQAPRVLAILENVYKTQLTSGGGRKEVAIPKGVDASVASVLQQINAAAAGPVLTLDIDAGSNALIVRGPPEIREEVRQFVEQLDQQAADPGARSVRVIRLRNSKSDAIRAALERFLEDDRRRSRRP